MTLCFFANIAYIEYEYGSCNGKPEEYDKPNMIRNIKRNLSDGGSKIYNVHLKWLEKCIKMT